MDRSRMNNIKSLETVPLSGGCRLSKASVGNAACIRLAKATNNPYLGWWVPPE
jgi:hypothetical protein